MIDNGVGILQEDLNDLLGACRGIIRIMGVSDFGRMPWAIGWVAISTIPKASIATSCGGCAEGLLKGIENTCRSNRGAFIPVAAYQFSFSRSLRKSICVLSADHAGCEDRKSV